MALFRKNLRSLLFQPLWLMACLAAWSVGAAENESYIEEVLVTAEFRDTAVTGLAASATVIEPDDMASSVHHLEEVLSRAPNVNYASGASRGRFIQIRGIGERGQFSSPLNPSVGLLLDGVDLSGVGTAATLFDVQQVEVLRGPQGTLYGANALAGLINVITPDPADDHGASVHLEAGDYGMFGAGVVLTGPMGENAGYRLSAQQYRDDGFIENDFLGKDDTDNHDEATYRAKFVWGGDRAQWQLVMGHVDIDNGYDAFSLENSRHTRSDQPGSDRQETTYGALSLAYDMSPGVDFAATVTHADSEIDYGYDEDWTHTGFHPWEYSSTDRYERDRETTTLDVRWLSKPGQSDWDWVAGVYALRQDVALTRTYTFAGGIFDSGFEVERSAVYGEVSRELAPAWRLVLGARLERHTSDYKDNAGVSFDPDDDLFGARVLLEHELDDGGLLYAGVTQGYKSGGFNIDGTLAADLREYDPEGLWNVEAGYKATLMDGRLSFRGAIFRMQRDDVQISTSTQREIDDTGAVEFIAYTGNAAEGFNQGVEVELAFAATEKLSLFANVGVLDTEYQDYIDGSGRDLDGEDQAHAPAYQFFAGAQYRFNDNWSARIELEGKDEFYFSDTRDSPNDRDHQSDSYELVNASVTYQAEHWKASLWGRNLTDEDYFVRGFYFGNDPRDFYTARQWTQLGEPRQVGLTLSADF